MYVARNPKDVAVSWYYLNIGIKTQGYIGDFPTFWNYFQNNLSRYYLNFKILILNLNNKINKFYRT